MDDDIPDLIRIANYEYDNLDKDDSEIDDETPLSVLLAKIKNPKQTAPFSLLIYNVRAQGLDAPPVNNDGFPVGPFRARFWTEPGDETIRWTGTFEYGLDPSWPGTTRIGFNNKVERGFLFLEIVRHGIEPCTSNGKSTIGRAKISLPEEVDERKISQCELVRSDGGECRIGVGQVMVTMKWETNRAVGANI